MKRKVQESTIPSLNKRAFNILANHRDFYCTSIFLPYDRENKKSTQTTVDRCLMDVSDLLSKKGLEKGSILEFVRDITGLMEEIPQDHPNLKGLAIFISKKSSDYFLLPNTVDYFIYINDHFYLKPIVPLFHNECRFMLLAIDNSEARFFNIAGGEMNWLWSYKNEKDISKNKKYRGRYESFLKEVYRRLIKKLRTGKEYLILAGKGNIKKKIQSSEPYARKYIYEISYEMNDDLQQKVYELCMQLSEKYKSRNIELFLDNFNRNSTTDETLEIVLSSVKGDIEVLFIDPEKEVFGEYDAENNYVFINRNNDHSGSSLTNIAAVHTILNGGSVYFVDQEEIPGNAAVMKAIISS